MNRLIYLIYSVTIIGLMLFTSCEENLKEENVENENLNLDYLPLQEGNYWELNYVGTRSINGIVMIDGKEYFQMINTASWTSVPRKDTTYLRKTADGKVYSRTLKSEESLLYDFKAALNQSWQNGTMRVTLNRTEGEKYLGNLKIQNCYSFYCDPRPQSADDEYDIWLAPGIGFVYVNYSGGVYNQNYILKRARINGIERSF